YGYSPMITGNSGQATIRNSEPPGQGRSATPYSAICAYSEPSVGISTRIPARSAWLFSFALTISTEQVAWRITACAVLPSSSRLNAPRPCDPSMIKSVFHSLANFGRPCRGLQTNAAVLTAQPASLNGCASSSSALSVLFFVSSSSNGARVKKNGSTAVTRNISVPFGHGRAAASWITASDEEDPSTAIRILMALSCGPVIPACSMPLAFVPSHDPYYSPGSPTRRRFFFPPRLGAGSLKSPRSERSSNFNQPWLSCPRVLRHNHISASNRSSLWRA